MDKKVFNDLLSKTVTLQTRLRSYISFKNEYYEKNNSNIRSEITFQDEGLLAYYTLDSNTSYEVLSFLIERTKTELEATAEAIKNMITEEE